MKKESQTLDMFEVPMPVRATPGSMHYALEVSHLISEILKATPIDRYEVSAQMSRLSGDDISKNTLDAWASPARTDLNMPFFRAPLFEAVCTSHELTDWLVEKRGGRAAYGKEAIAAKLGQVTVMKRALEQQIRELQKMMEAAG